MSIYEIFKDLHSGFRYVVFVLVLVAIIQSLLGWLGKKPYTEVNRKINLFALISAGMSIIPSSFQPGLPANGSLWRTVAMFLLLVGLAFALLGVMSHLFEQVDRRSETERQAARRKRRGESE